MIFDDIFMKFKLMLRGSSAASDPRSAIIGGN